MQGDTPVEIFARRRGKLTKTHYDLRWYDGNGKRRSKFVGTDRKVADRARARLELELAEGTHFEDRKTTWSAFVDEHIGLMSRRPATVEDVARTLKEFGEVCEPRSPKHVTYTMLEEYHQHLRAKGNALGTRNKRLRYLRSVLNTARKRAYIKSNPMDQWAWEREERKVPRVLNDGEKAKLLEACPTDQWRTFVHIALTTGCRRGELLGLTWDRVSFDDASFVVTGTKAHQDRVQPLDPIGVGMLRDLQVATLRDGGPFQRLKTVNAANRFRIIVKRAGITHCCIHDLRKTFCTDLARLGVNQLVVQRLVGHKSGATTAKYYQHIDDGTKRAAVAKLTGA